MCWIPASILKKRARSFARESDPTHSRECEFSLCTDRGQQQDYDNAHQWRLLTVAHISEFNQPEVVTASEIVLSVPSFAKELERKEGNMPKTLGYTQLQIGRFFSTDG
jgi:hypothetical protein